MVQSGKRKVVKAVLWVATVAILLVIAAQIVVIGFFSIQGYRCFAVETGSMEPSYPVGALIAVKKIDTEQVQTGMVLTFYSADNPKKTFTHRVASLDHQNRLVYTKGDNNPVNDPEPTSMDYIVGEVEHSFPYMGYLYLFSHSKTGLILLGLMLLLWLSFEAERYFYQKRGKQSCVKD